MGGEDLAVVENRGQNPSPKTVQKLAIPIPPFQQVCDLRVFMFVFK
jgi:hypothetical protein